MPYIADMMEVYRRQGRSVGNGQCVTFVHAVVRIPKSSEWTRGEKVRGAWLTEGTIIATFESDERYGNRTDGSSHAAVYLGQNDEGIVVMDQWVAYPMNQPVHKRLIRFKSGVGHPANDGDKFYVVY